MFYSGEIPVLRLMIPLTAGILAACVYSRQEVYNVALPIVITSFVLLSLSIANYRKFSLYKFKWIPGFLLYLSLLSSDYWITANSSERFDRSHYSVHNADAFIAEIRSEPKLSRNIARFEARVLSSYLKGRENKATGTILISVYADSAKDLTLNYGDLVLMPALYTGIDPPRNPGEFDYKSYLARRQVYHQAFLGQDRICLVDRSRGNQIIAFALELRKKLVDKFYRYLPDKNAAAFASTLILGYRAELSRELIEAYSDTGTMHVLSVSGMHVGIVFVVLSALLQFMNKTKCTRLIRALVIISVIWFYAMLTGFSAAASRAALMLSFIVLGKALNRSQNTYNLVAISAFFLLLYNPFYLADTGFQLSYLAVIGLVYFYPKIYQSLYVQNKLLDYIWSYSALSIGAQLATSPLSIYYFHQFPVYFLIANVFIVLPVAFIMYAGIAFMFIPFNTVLLYLGQLLNWMINFINNALFYIENLPFSSWDGIWINVFECALIGFVLLFLSLLISYGYKKLIFPIAVLMIALFLSFTFRGVRNYSQPKIVFYNLRKNTAMAFIVKNRSVIVSDLDKSDKLTGFSVLPAVKSSGSRQETFYHISDTFENNLYAGNPNFYQFGDYRIVRWDKTLDSVSFSKVLKIDAVLLTGNPNITLKYIIGSLNFTRLIIDANNPHYKVKEWIGEATRMNIRCDVLKNSSGLVILL